MWLSVAAAVLWGRSAVASAVHRRLASMRRDSEVLQRGGLSPARLAARRGGGEAEELSGSRASSHAALGLRVARAASVDYKSSLSNSKGS